MLESHNHGGTNTAFLRPIQFVLSVILVLTALAAHAQKNSLAGQWRGVFRGITLTIVIQPNGQYSQLAQSGTLMTQQSGPYKLVAPNTIIFSVTNWAPKTQQVYHPTGTAGGTYSSEVVAKPSGATDKYVFNGPNTITLTDEMAGGSIALTRAP